MVLAARVIPPSPLEVWRLIEEDFTLRLSLKTREWNTQRQKDINQISHQARESGNSAFYYPALIEYEEKHANERAEWAYQTCLEIWEIQGQKKSHAFYRAVLEGCLTPLFANRNSCVAGEIQLRQMRLRSVGGQSTAALRSFSMAMGRLISEWAARLEIASRDNDYQEQQTREREYKNQKAREREAQAIRTTALPTPLFPLVALSNKPKVTGKPKALTATERKKRSAIFAAISTRDEGLKYCKTLDERKLAIPAAWIQDGCPKNYPDAYKAGQPWQKRIQDEKSRYKKKFDQTPAAEREKLLL
jgi:hypothetical protein